jgi:hypothetical protein
VELSIISIKMMIYIRIRDERTEWSGLEIEEKRTKNRTLRNTKKS